MIPIAQDTPAETPVAPRNIQGQSLEQIVKLSIECAGEEQRIEKHHAEGLARVESDLQKAVEEAEEEKQRRLREVNKDVEEQAKAVQARFETKRKAVETARQNAQRQIVSNKEDTESAIKKQVEHESWESEKVLVALEMRLDAEAQHAKRTQEVSQPELASLKSVEIQANDIMSRYRMEAMPVDATMDAALEKRINEDRLAVMVDYRKQSVLLLRELQAVTRPHLKGGVIVLLLTVLGTGALGAAGWAFPQDGQTKLLTAGAGALLAFVMGTAAFVFVQLRNQSKIKAKALAVYQPLKQALAMAYLAARYEIDAGAAARKQRVKEAREKRDHDVNAAKEKVKVLQAKATEKYRAAVAEESQGHKKQLAEVEQEKRQGLEEIHTTSEAKTAKIEEESLALTQQAKTRHDQARQTIDANYEKECLALASRWDAGLKAVHELLEAGSGIDPQLVDWNSPAWEKWKSPQEFSGQVRFGDMEVDLAQLTEHVPKRLKLPGTFRVPAMLALPDHASLLVETDHTGRNASNDVAQLVMARLLTQAPAGRVKFIIFDPVGLGQSFAGFMHLADHDESLVGSRIWTESEHMQQRLADLTEHMETVIQKYLRNEFATIDEYNAKAGELAEPYRFLVVADFPTGFEQESLRRLCSIAISGPRCGVHTIILRDTSQPVPRGSRMEEIISRSVNLKYKNGAFTWDDEVFKRFPLRIDPPPSEETLTRLMDQVGRAAKEAKRVEVPFESIAPPEGQFWSLSSKNDIAVPIGKSGAMRLQSLRLGVGVAQHALVAGKTGSGKSNLMHTIVTNLAMWYGPDEIEFYLIDFKKGVEFKAYATSMLPHARAIAVESDREFGLSVLQRVDAELTRRGARFRDVGAQEISAYRQRTGEKLPRTVLLIDEFQEFFSEDDKIGQEAAGLLDRLARQGRAFGVHMVLGSQTIGGGSGLPRSTLGQIAVRVALQCTEADSQIILGDNNSAARLLTRPGEAIYNDAGGLVEANSPFQIAFLPDGQREHYLEHIKTLSVSKAITAPTPIIFEGNSAALIRSNKQLMALLEQPTAPASVSTVAAYVGEPVAIKDPSSIPFRHQSGGNLLMVGQQEESAVAIFASIAASIAAQQKPADAMFYLMDGSPADSRYFGLLERVLATLPQQTKIVDLRHVPEAINDLAKIMAERQGDDTHAGPAVYLLMFGLQRYRVLRHQEDDFSFSKSDEAAAPKTDKQFADLLLEGPALGLHTLIWADAPVTLERTLERASMRQFDHRILFQMSAADSSNLIDSPLANRLGTHRALLYSEEQGTFEKFRPYQVPDAAWIEFLAGHLKNRPG